MYILRRVAKFVGGQYTGHTRPQKVKLWKNARDKNDIVPNCHTRWAPYDF